MTALIYWALGLLGKVLEGLILNSFFRAASKHRKGYKYATMFAFAVYIALSLATLSFDTNAAWNGLLSFVFTFMVSFSYKLPNSRRLIYSTILVILIILAEILTGLIFSAFMTGSIETLTGDLIFYFIAVLFSRFIIMVMMKPAQLHLSHSEVKVPIMFYLALMAFPVSSFVIMASVWDLVYQLDEGVVLLMAAVLVLLIANIAVFYIFESYLTQLEKQTSLQMLNQQMEYQTTHFRELAEARAVSNQTLHDLKNTLFAVADMVTTDPEGAALKMKEINRKVAIPYGFISTNNDAIDALLTSKHKRMKEVQIEFHFKCFMPAQNSIDNIDLCVLLGNLVDNAIEACEKVTKDRKVIRLHIAQSGEYLMVRISNTVQGIVQEEDGHIATTKKNKKNHGFGLRSIQTICEKYGGYSSFEQEGEIFTVIASMRNSE